MFYTAPVTFFFTRIVIVKARSQMDYKSKKAFFGVQLREALDPVNR